MKKKLLMIFLLLFTLTLASCSNGNGAPSSRSNDSVSANYTSTYGLDTLTKIVGTKDETDAYRYELYVAENTGSSIVLYSKNIENQIKNHGDRSLKITPTVLSFASETADGESYSYKTKFLDEEVSKTISVLNEVVGDTDKGVTFVKLLGELSFDYYDATNPESAYIDVNKTYDASLAVKAYNDGKTVTFNTVYVPVLVKRFYETNLVLNSYLFVPVYSCYAVLDGSSYKMIEADGDSYKLTAIDFGKAATELAFVKDTMLLLTGNEANPEYK